MPTRKTSKPKRKCVSHPKAQVTLGADADKWLGETILAAQVENSRPDTTALVMLGAGIGSIITWLFVALAYLIQS